MSNIYRYAIPAVPHFQIPHAVDKWLNSISLEEIRLMLLVHSEAERLSRSEVSLTTDQICQRTGMHRTNISKVRKALVDYGLLLTKQVGRAYTYIVVDPSGKRPIADKTTLLEIDFNASPSALTKYIQAIIKGSKLTKEGITGTCPLPGHNDGTPSFVMDVDQGGKWWCRGCGKSGRLVALEQYLSEDAMGNRISQEAAHTVVRDKLRALGLGNPATAEQWRSGDIVYNYRSQVGEILLQVIRRDGSKQKFYQRRPDPNKPHKWLPGTQGCVNSLYNLQNVGEAGTVIVVEGEKDADTLTQLGLKDDIGDSIAVVTCRNGAGAWLPDHSETLKCKRVILCGDTDQRGIEHIEQVRTSLVAAGVKELMTISLPVGFKDVSQFLESRRPSEFVALAGPDWLEPIEDETVEI